MQGSRGNGNTLIQHENCEAILNKAECEKIMEETQENSSLQTKKSKDFKMMKKKMIFFFGTITFPKKTIEAT
jgi:hypothetical protein